MSRQVYSSSKSVERFELVCHGVQDIGGHKVEQGSLF